MPTAYHPETGGTVEVDEDQLAHMRVSGWMTVAEHDANQAERAEAEQAAADAAKSPAPKTAGKTAGKDTDEHADEGM